MHNNKRKKMPNKMPKMPHKKPNTRHNVPRNNHKQILIRRIMCIGMGIRGLINKKEA